MLRSACFVVGILVLPAASSAEEVAYVEVSSELDGGKPATYGYNLVDGKDTTAWCSTKSPGKQTIVYGFDKPQKITHIAIVVGQKKGDALDPNRARAKTLWVSDGEIRREIAFKDVPELQEVKLDPAITARRVIIDVPVVRSPEALPEAPLCISELTLKNGSRELSGDDFAKKLRALPTPARKLLHSWVDDPAAPERTLIFSVDGTFTYTFEPLMEGDPAKVSGKWSTAGKVVNFEVRGKKTTMKMRSTKIDDGEKQTTELMLEGDGPGASMNSTYRVAPARYGE